MAAQDTPIRPDRTSSPHKRRSLGVILPHTRLRFNEQTAAGLPAKLRRERGSTLYSYKTQQADTVRPPEQRSSRGRPCLLLSPYADAPLGAAFMRKPGNQNKESNSAGRLRNESVSRSPVGEGRPRPQRRGIASRRINRRGRSSVI